MMNPVIRHWSGQRVWVIGASTGIGAETARQSLAKGTRVTLSTRRAEPLEELAAGHANALLALLDITDHATVLAARDQLLAA